MKARVFWITLSALLALTIVSFVVATQWFQGYLRGKEFLALISNLTGSSLRSTATFEPLRWTGASAYSETVTLQGNPGSGVGFVDARQLRADMNWRAILDGAWRIEEINITHLDGDFAISVPQTDEAPPPTIDVVQNTQEQARRHASNPTSRLGSVRTNREKSLVDHPLGQSFAGAPPSTSRDSVPLLDATQPNVVGTPLNLEQDIRDVDLRPRRFLMHCRIGSGLCSRRDYTTPFRTAKVVIAKEGGG